VLLVSIPKARSLTPGSIFALYVALYSLGRGFIELIRIDDSNLILGLRLNVFTSITLFTLATLYVIRSNRGKSSSNTPQK
jgi:prolipoprotein diacylglyceryltransferase